MHFHSNETFQVVVSFEGRSETPYVTGHIVTRQLFQKFVVQNGPGTHKIISKNILHINLCFCLRLRGVLLPVLFGSGEQSEAGKLGEQGEAARPARDERVIDFNRGKTRAVWVAWRGRAGEA